MGQYSHLKNVSDKIHLSGGAIDLLIGTDFVEAFIDIHTVSGEPGEPIGKRNCFGWYVLGQFESSGSTLSEIQSIEVGTVSVEEDIKKLLHQDLLGVKPTKLCTCTENVLRESKFVKSLAASTTLVDGRIQVKMPWKEGGPPKRSNYDIALKRMFSAERGFLKKGCFEVVKEEVQKLLDQNFITKIPPEQIAHDKPEWYLPLQVVFTPERTTKVRLVFDSSSKGHDGLSLNDCLEKGPNFINSFASFRGHPRVCWSDYGTNFVGAQSCKAGTFPRFTVFYVRNSPVISNGNGIYFTQAIRMASWKPSSSPSDKVSMLHARIRPLRRNNGEHFSRRQRTSSTDALCFQVLTTSGKLHLSHRMIFLLVSIFHHLNQNLRRR